MKMSFQSKIMIIKKFSSNSRTILHTVFMVVFLVSQSDLAFLFPFHFLLEIGRRLHMIENVPTMS